MFGLCLMLIFSVLKDSLKNETVGWREGSHYNLNKKWWLPEIAFLLSHGYFSLHFNVIVKKNSSFSIFRVLGCLFMVFLTVILILLFGSLGRCFTRHLES